MSGGAATDVHRVGEHALLIDLESIEQVHRVARAARRRLGGQAREVVPGAATVLIVLDAGAGPGAVDELAADVPRWTIEPVGRRGTAVRIPVVYDGPDLDDVARAAGLTRDAVIAAHTDAEHTVDFLGFAPGFAYLSGGTLHVPRLATPRTAVPAGSVALAGRYCAVYPAASPGGWRIIGRTDLAMWDSGREPPALLEAGDRVRFVRAG